jgi:hypothetical protein
MQAAVETGAGPKLKLNHIDKSNQRQTYEILLKQKLQ